MATPCWQQRAPDTALLGCVLYLQGWEPPKGRPCKAMKWQRALKREEGFPTTQKPVLRLHAVSLAPTVCPDTMELNSRAAETAVKGEGN